ncbi:regulatory subunit for Cdc7p protein kinase, partial [Phenoliferia sp. Uapishka_3]
GSSESESAAIPQTKRPRKAVLPLQPSQPTLQRADVAARDVTNAAAAADAARRKKRERQEKHEKMEAESLAWRQKYKKAFPSFVFYFDHIDEATTPGLTKQVERLGSTVDNFFSKKVTHVVTTRPVPGTANKENLGSPGTASRQSFAATLAASASIGPSRTKRPSSRQSPVGYVGLDGKQLRPYGDGREKNPFIDHQDILSKASEFGLKIWRLDKIQNMLSRIHSNSPVKADPNVRRKMTLPSLLRDEQLFGTRERDPFVPRPDMHYFNTTLNRYLLVEDSTGEHRPIVAKEYEKPRKGHDPHWPVLYGGLEGRGAFYHYEGPPIVHENRLRRPSPPEEDREDEGAQEEEKEAKPELLPAADVPFKGHAAFAARAVAPNLRRTASLNRLSTAHAPKPTAVPKNGSYLAASGNSQTITSTVASATSTRGGAPVLGGAFGNGPLVNRRLATLNRSTVPTRFGGQQTAPGKLKRSVSVDAGLSVKAPPPREEPKKPGYCENCRLKYDDFKEHVLVRKHRKFARNPDNWIELDMLLSRIDRPYASRYDDSPVSEGDSGFYEQADMDCSDEEEPEPSDEGEVEDAVDEDEDEEEDGGEPEEYWEEDLE